MPTTNYGDSILSRIKDAMLGVTNDWPADPRNVAEGYRQLWQSKTPGTDYLNAIKEIGINLGRDTQGYLNKVNTGDIDAMMPFMMMIKNPRDPKYLLDRTRERILMNRAMGRQGNDLLRGIPQSEQEIAAAEWARQKAAAQMARAGEEATQGGKFLNQAAGETDDLATLLKMPYEKLTPKQKVLVDNALTPDDFAGGMADGGTIKRATQWTDDPMGKAKWLLMLSELRDTGVWPKEAPLSNSDMNVMLAREVTAYENYDRNAKNILRHSPLLKKNWIDPEILTTTDPGDVGDRGPAHKYFGRDITPPELAETLLRYYLTQSERGPADYPNRPR